MTAATSATTKQPPQDDVAVGFGPPRDAAAGTRAGSAVPGLSCGTETTVAGNKLDENRTNSNSEGIL